MKYDIDWCIVGAHIKDELDYAVKELENKDLTNYDKLDVIIYLLKEINYRLDGGTR